MNEKSWLNDRNGIGYYHLPEEPWEYEAWWRPEFSCLSQPNPRQTWKELYEQVKSDERLYGRGFLFVLDDASEVIVLSALRVATYFNSKVSDEEQAVFWDGNRPVPIPIDLLVKTVQPLVEDIPHVVEKQQ